MMLTVATWNVNSIGVRLPLLLRWLEPDPENLESTKSSEAVAAHPRPDIICLQEIKCIEAKFPVSALTEKGFTSFVFGQPTYNGVAILVRDELIAQYGLVQAVQKGFPTDPEESQRRLIDLTLGPLRLINVYVPNGQEVGSDKYRYKLEWYSQLRAYLDQHCDLTQKLLLCGDFNVAPQPIDVYNPAQFEGKVLFSEPEKAALQTVADWGLTDAFRQLNPGQTAYSWWDYRQNAFPRNMGLRIDQIWLTASLLAQCQHSWIDREPRTWERPSDHTPVVASFQL